MNIIVTEQHVVGQLFILLLFATPRPPPPALDQVTGQTVEVSFVDQGYTGEEAECAAAVPNIDLQIMKKPEEETGFVLLPTRWVVERSFAWLSPFRRLGRDYERLSVSLQQLHFVVFACIMPARPQILSRL